MAEYNTMYSQARYYDIVFNRDVSREVDFVSTIYQQHTGQEVESVLELACGPGYHARAYARRGVRAVGLDLREEMIEFAREHAEPEAQGIEWLAGDMRNFQLHAPVNVALSMFDAIDCLLTNEEIVQHFRAIAANLTPGGLYVLENTHPRDCAPYQYGDFQYHGERDGCDVTITWATNNPVVNPLTQVISPQVEIRICENGNTTFLTDQASERFIAPQEFYQLAELSGVFTITGWYGDFNLNQPFDNTPAARRMILVLQKKAEAAKQESQYFSPRLEVRSNPRKGGLSVYAREPISRGELLAVWGGNVLTSAQLPPKPEWRHRHPLQIEEDLFILPDASSERAEYFCHSCDPNAGISGQIGLVALRDIKAGEEVCDDYAMTDGSEYDEFACACGSANCRERVTGEDWRRPELQARYAGYFSPYLQRRIDRLAIEQTRRRRW